RRPMTGRAGATESSTRAAVFTGSSISDTCRVAPHESLPFHDQSPISGRRRDRAPRSDRPGRRPRPPHTTTMSGRRIETVVASGSFELRVREEGSGDPVLLLHGFADTLDTWWDTGWASALAGHRAIAFDARGHGGSSCPHDPAHYTMAARVGDAI